MPKFLLMPEGCTWQEIDRPQQKLETIYGLESSFYSPGHRIAIRNQETGETRVFCRELDAAGNLLRVYEV